MTDQIPQMHIKSLETGETIHSFDVRHLSSRHIEKVLRGCLMRIDRGRFFVDDSEVWAALEKAKGDG